MKTLTKKKTKVWIASVGSALLATILALTGIGLAFKLKNKPKADSPIGDITQNLDFAVDAWDGQTSNGDEFEENYAGRGQKTRTIDSASSFIYFVNEVNAGNQFEGYTIYLNKNIDLAGHGLDSIGTEQKPFMGTFDGGYYTIFNAKIDGEGLFGATNGATIKNIGLYNSSIESDEEVVGGLVGNALNTNIENSFIRLKEISSENNAGGLVGTFTSNNGEHYIKNSFVDTSIDADKVGGLIYELDTNNSSENLVTIENSYYTAGSRAVSVVDNESNLELNKVIKPKSVKDFKSWDYDAEYEKFADWCDVPETSIAGGMDFNYPILKGFAKVYSTGSCYEGVVIKDGEAVEITNLPEAFINGGNEAEINLLVEKIFMEDRATATENQEIAVNAVKDTTIVRGEDNADSLFFAEKGATITLGTQTAGEVGAMSDEATPKIILDGNREYIEENNLESGALVVAVDAVVNINDNVIIKDNINTTVGYGGGVIVYNPSEDSVVNGTIENCSAEHAGGGLVVVRGQGDVAVGSINNCSTEGNGGACALIDEIDNEQAMAKMSKLYNGGKALARPVATTVSSTITLTNSKTYSGNSGTNGGAYYVTGGTLTFPTSSSYKVTFSSNHATKGGAIYKSSTTSLVVRYADFSMNYAAGTSSAYAYGGAICCTTGQLFLYAGSTFSSNYATYSSTTYRSYGGTIYHGSTSSSYYITINGTSISFTQGDAGSIQDACYGAFIYSKSYVLFSGGTTTFQYGSARVNGGAIQLGSSSYPMRISGTTTVKFLDNYASSWGGAVCGASSSATAISILASAKATLEFTGNDATTYGGAVYGVVDNAGLATSTIKFEKNTVTASYAYGGALYGNFTDSVGATWTFDSNTCANGYGGGAYISGDFQPNSAKVDFRYNEAKYGGGLCLSGTGTQWWQANVSLSMNKADYGAGIYYPGTGSFYACGTALSNNATTAGGTIYAPNTTIYAYNAKISSSYSVKGAGIYAKDYNFALGGVSFDYCGSSAPMYATGSVFLGATYKPSFSNNSTSYADVQLATTGYINADGITTAYSSGSGTNGKLKIYQDSIAVYVGGGSDTVVQAAMICKGISWNYFEVMNLDTSGNPRQSLNSNDILTGWVVIVGAYNKVTVSGSFTYDGTEKTWTNLTVTGYHSGFTAIGTTKATNAGTYSVTINAPTYSTFTDGSTTQSLTWTINKATGWVSASSQIVESAYGTASKTFTVSNSHGGTLSVSDNHGTATVAISGTTVTVSSIGGLSAGTTFMVTISCAATTNYTAASVGCTIYIARAKTATASANTGLVYTGSSQTGVSGSNVTWTGTTSATNAGSYTAKATPTSNYAWSDGTYAEKSVSWSIAKKNGYVTLNLYSGASYYGTASSTFIVSSHHGGTLSVSDTNSTAGSSISGTTVTLSSLGGLSAGTSFTVTVTSAATTNYTAASNTYTHTISRARTATASAANKTYTGSSQTGVTGSYVSWSGNTTGTNAGSYTAYATPTSNYAWSDGTYAQKTITWTMNKASGYVTITYSNVNVSYGTGTASNFASGAGTLSVSDNHSSVTVGITAGNISISGLGSLNAGTVVTVTVSVAAATNYNATSGTFTVTIVRAKSASASAKTGLKYTGSSQTGVTGSYVSWSGTTSATNAGSYTAKATPTSNYAWSDGTYAEKSISWSIAKVAGWVTLSATSGSIQYGTTSATFTVSSYTGTLSVSDNNSTAGSSISGTTVTISSTGGLAAGTSVVVTVSAAAATNYNAASATYTLSIIRNKSASASAKTGLKYTGSTQTGVTGSYVSWSGTTSAINAGSYTAKATPTSNYAWSDGTYAEKSVSWSIAKIAGSVKLSATSGSTSYGTASKTFTVSSNHGGTLSVSDNHGTATVSISSTTVTIADMGRISPTSFTVTVTCAATTNYNAASATYTHTINKASGYVTITNSNVNVSYGTGTASNFASGSGTLSVSDNHSSVTVGITAGNISISGLGSLNAGTVVTVTVSVAAATNYNATSGTFTVTIVRAKSATASAKTGLSYTGSAQTGVSGSNVTWTGNTTGTNAGSYTAKATPTSNYAWSDGTYAEKSVSWSIAKVAGSVKLSATSGSTSYGTASKTFTVSSNHGGTLSVSDNHGTATVSISGTTVTIANMGSISPTSFTVTVTCAATTNYNAASATYTHTINKASGYVTLSATSGSTSYGTSSKTFTVTKSHGGTLSVSDNHGTATVSISSTTVTIANIGSISPTSFTVTVTSAATTNYNAASATYTHTINKSSGWVILPSSNYDIAYGTASTGVTITSGNRSGSINGVSDNHGTATCSYSGDTVTVSNLGSLSAGTVVTVTVSVAATTNQNAASSSFTVTIVRAKSASASAKTGLSYNKSEQTGVNGSYVTWTGTTKATDAGSYTAKATPTSNYAWSDGTYAQKTITWSIAKAAGSVKLSATSGSTSYGTASKTFTVSSNHGGTLSVSDNHGTATVSISGTTVTIANMGSISPTSFTVTVTCAATTNYNAASATYTHTINKASGYVTLSLYSTSTSYGTASSTNSVLTSHGGTLSVSDNNSTAESSISGTTITLSSLGGIAAGTSFTVTVSCAATTNFNAASIAFTHTINKASGLVSISYSNVNVSYGTGTATNSAAGTGTLSVSDNNSSVTVGITAGNISISGLGALSAGTVVTVTVSSAATTNYNAASGTFTVTIVRAKTASASAKTGLIYNTSEQTGVNGSCVTWTGTTKATNAGSYTAKATPTSNYAWSDGTYGEKSISWSIGAATFGTHNGTSITVTPFNGQYNGNVRYATIKISGVGGATVLSSSTSNYTSATTSTVIISSVSGTAYNLLPGRTDVGSLTVYFTVSLANYNNYASSTTVTVTRSRTASAEPAFDLTYTGNELQGVYGSNVTLTGTTKATNAGSYTAYATPTSNYAWSDGTYAQKTISWSIGRTTGYVNFSTSGMTVSYGTASTSFTVSHHGGTLSAKDQTALGATTSASGTTVTVSNIDKITAGMQIEIVVTSAQSTNHYAASKTFIITIGRASGWVTLSPTSGSTKYGVNVADFTISDSHGGAYSASCSNSNLAVVCSGSSVSIEGIGSLSAGSTFTVTVTSATTTNYKSASATYTHTIAKADGYIVTYLVSDSIEYGTSEYTFGIKYHSGPVSATDNNSSTTLQIVDGDVKVTGLSSVSVGALEITVTSAETSDYYAASYVFTLNIVRKKSATAYAVENKVFNEDYQTCFLGDYVTWSTDVVYKNAGTYTVQATPTSNYAWSDGSYGAKSISCTIAKATLGTHNNTKVTVTANTSTYDGNPHYAIIKVTGTSGLKIQSSDTGTDALVSVTTSSSLGTVYNLLPGITNRPIGGVATIYYQITSSNYKDYTGITSVTINQANNPISVSGRTLNYSGSSQNLVTVSGAQGDVYYSTSTQLTSSNYSSSGSTTIPTGTAAGTYTIYYYCVGNNNYNAKSGSVSTTINNATLGGSVSISGINVEGQTLGAITSCDVSSVSLSYQWYYSSTAGATSGGTAISGATGSTWTVTSSYLGKYIYVQVSASKTNYTSETWKDATDTTNNRYQKVGVAFGISKGTTQWKTETSVTVEAAGCTLSRTTLTTQDVTCLITHEYESGVTINVKLTKVKDGKHYYIILANTVSSFDVDDVDSTTYTWTTTGSVEINWNVYEAFTVKAAKETGVETATFKATDQFGNVLGDNCTTYTYLPHKSDLVFTAKEKAGYTWAGWYNGSTRLTEDKTYTVEDNIVDLTYTAKATANSYTVKYDGNGSNGGTELSDSTFTYGEDGTLRTNTFTRSYTVTLDANGGSVSPTSKTSTYKFLGWSTSKTATTATYADGASVKNLATSGSITLYAVWEKVSVELPNATKTGYKFGGWNTKSDGTGSTVSSPYTPTANITLYAVWTINKYTVELSAGTGIDSVSGAGTYDYNEEVTIIATLKTGYHFVNWTGHETKTTATYTFKMPASDIEFTANGAINTYTLKIDPNGGYRVSDNSTSVIEVEKDYGATESISERKRTDYTLTGYEVQNASSGSTTDIGGATITFDASTKTATFTQGTVAIKLVAQWSLNQATIKLGTATNLTIYYGTSSTSQTTKLTTTGFTADANKTYYFKYVLDSATGYSYTFDGWSGGSVSGTDNPVSLDFDDDGGTYTISASATKTANTYKVTYNANGGSGTMDQSSHTYGTTSALTANGFTRTGYGFSKWNTKADGSGTDYANKADMTKLTSNLTLYAIWSANTYTVSFDSNGGSDVDDIEVTYNGKYPALTTPTKEGYTFGGWFLNTTEIKEGSTVSTADDHELVAKWSVNSYEVKLTVNTAAYGSFKIKDDTTAYTIKTIKLPFGTTWSVSNNVLTFSNGTTVTATETTDNNQYDYSFSGFAKASGTVGASGADISVKFARATKKYTIKFTVDPADCVVKQGTTTVTQVENVEYGTTISTSGNTITIGSTVYTATVVDKTGYNTAFKEWQNVTSWSTTGTLSTTIKAVFTRSAKTDITVEFDSHGGTEVENKTVTFDSTYGTLETPTRTGYTFAGWWTAETAGTQVTKDTKVTTATTHTLHAKWTINYYLVDINLYNPAGTQDGVSGTFDIWYSDEDKTYTNQTDGPRGYFSNESDRNTLGIAYGTEIRISNITPATGMELKSVTNLTWNATGSYYTFTVGTKDVNLNMQMAYSTYQVVFNNNGNTWIDQANVDVTYNSQLATVPSVTGVKEWNTKADGTGTAISTSTVFNTTNIASTNTTAKTFTVYAIVYAKKISFIDETFTGHDSSEDSVRYNEVITLPTLTQSGYTFNGWYSKDGKTSYGAGGASYTNKDTNNTELKMYASWTVKPVTIATSKTKMDLTFGYAKAEVSTITASGGSGTWKYSVSNSTNFELSTTDATTSSVKLYFKAGASVNSYTTTVTATDVNNSQTATTGTITVSVKNAAITVTAKWSNTLGTVEFTASKSSTYEITLFNGSNEVATFEVATASTSGTKDISSKLKEAKGTYKVTVLAIPEDSNYASNEATTTDTLSTYQLTVAKGEGISAVSGTEILIVGESQAISATVATGYNWGSSAMWTATGTTPTTFTATTQNQTIVMGAGDATLTASATLNTGTIKLGTATNLTVYYGTTASSQTTQLTTAGFAANALSTYYFKYVLDSAEGYTFAFTSWSGNVSGTAATTSLSFENAGTYTVSATASKTANTYTATLDGNGGTISNLTAGTNTTASSSVVTATYDKEGTFTSTPSRDGYTFVGYSQFEIEQGSLLSTDGSEINDNTIRLRTGFVPIQASSSVPFTIKDLGETGYWLSSYMLYKSDKSYISSSYVSIKKGNLTQNVVTTSATAYVRFTLCRSDFGNLTLNNLVNFSFVRGNGTLANGALTSGTTTTTIKNLATSGNQTLYAQWVQNAYQVKFDANGGAGLMDPQDFTYDASAKKLTANAFTRTGYEFVSWNTKQDGTGKTYANEESVQNLTTGTEITLYAQWTAIPVEISATTITDFVNYGYVTTDVATIQASGGSGTWKFSLSNSTNFELSNTDVTTDTTVTLRFKAGANVGTYSTTVTVKDDINGKSAVTGTITITVEPERVTLSVNWSETLGTIEFKAESASTFKLTLLKGTETVATKDVTTASAELQTWKVAETMKEAVGDYKVKVTADPVSTNYGNTTVESEILSTYQLTVEKGTGISAVSGTEILIEGETKAISATVANGHTWSKWTATGTALEIFDEKVQNQTITMGAGNATLTASATANTYTVTYNANGGTGSMPSETIVYGQTYVCPENKFTKTGHSFSHWVDNHGSSWDGRIGKEWTWTYDSDTTLTAQWTPNTYTITYKANGGTGSMESDTVVYGTSYVCPENEFTREGYTFSHWEDSLGSSWDGYIGEAWTWTYTTDIDLIAQWTANTYTITYNGNGATDGSTETSTHIYDIASALTLNGFTREGYKFEGWATSSTGKVVHLDGATVKNLATSGTIELFAIWSTIPVAISTSATSANVTYGYAKTDIATISASGGSGTWTYSVSNSTNFELSETNATTNDVTLRFKDGAVVGTYTTTVTATDKYNELSATTATITVTVGKADMTVTAVGGTWTYDATEHFGTISVDVDGATIVSGTSTSYGNSITTNSVDGKTYNLMPSIVNAGEITVYYKVACDNYFDVAGSIVLVVEKEEITPIVSMADYTYAGTKSEPSISGVQENATVTYYYNTINSNQNGTAWSTVTSSTSLPAGVYYMYATVAESSNYNGATTDAVEFKVLTSTTTLTVAWSKTLGTIEFESSQSATYVLTLYRGETQILTESISSPSKSGTWNVATTMRENAGSYTVKVASTPENASYTGLEVTSTALASSLIQLSKGTGIATVAGNGIYIHGEVVALRATAQAGYTWRGWYNSSSEMVSNNNPYNHTISGNLALTAKTTANKYTVTFDANGGTVNPSSKEVTFNESYGELPTPTREGHTLLGWMENYIDLDDLIEFFNTHSSNSASYPMSREGDLFMPYAQTALRDGKYILYPINLPAGTYTLSFAGWHENPTEGNVTTGIIMATKVTGGTSSVVYENGNYLTCGYSDLAGIRVINKSETIYATTFTITPEQVGNTYIRFGASSNYATYMRNVLLKAGIEDSFVTAESVVEKPRDITLTAKWKVNNYNLKLNFMVDGVASATAPAGTSVNLTVGGTANNTITSYSESIAYGTKYQLTGVNYNTNQYAVDFTSTEQTLGANATTITITFTTKEYKVTFTAGNYGTVDKTEITAKYGSAITVAGNKVTISSTTVTATATQVTGHTTVFKDWTNATGTVTGARTITANFERTPNDYIVTLDANGGIAEPSKLEVTYGGKYVGLEDPTREGHTFLGWFLGETQITENSYVTTADDHTLVASWKVNQYTLTVNFVVDGETLTTAPSGVTVNMTIGGTSYHNMTSYSEKLAYGTKYQVTAISYNASQYDIAVDSNELTLGAKDTTLTITLTTRSYDITFVAGEFGSVDKTKISAHYGSTITVAGNKVTIEGATVTASPIELDGYTTIFVDWTNATGTVDGAREITANFKRDANKYQVTFDANTGSVGTTSKEVTFNKPYGELPVPTKDGYSFLGWFLEENEITSTTTVATPSDHTLVAKWKLNEFTITYKPNYTGATATDVTQKVVYNTNYLIKDAETFTRTGYTLSGWSTTEDGQVEFNCEEEYTYTAETHMTLYAVWTANVYKVVYNANGGQGSMTYSTHTYDKAQTLKPNAYSRVGYTFNGWSTTSTGQVVYQNEQNVKNLTSINGDEIELFAVWGENTYYVEFNANNGTGSMEKQTFKYTDNKALTANAFEREGYEFNGWNTVANGSGVAYENGQKVTGLASKTTDGETITLYAQWKITVYTITYHGLDGAIVSGNPIEYKVTDETFTLNNPTMAGFEFKGWSGTDIDGTTKTVTITKGSTGNREYTAVWLAEITLKVSGADGNTYGVRVYDASLSLVGTYNTSFKVIKGETYTFTVFSDLNADSTTNSYQIVQLSYAGELVTTQASPISELEDYTVLEGTAINASTEIKLEYFNAYRLAVDATNAEINGFTMLAPSKGVIVENIIDSSYIIAVGTEVRFEINSTPKSPTRPHTYIGFKFTAKGTAETQVGVDGLMTHVQRTEFEQNENYLADGDIGTHSYKVVDGVEISSIRILTRESSLVYVYDTEDIEGTITLTSELGFHKVIDSDTKKVVLYSGRWLLTSTEEISISKLNAIFPTCTIDDSDPSGKIYVVVSTVASFDSGSN